jgi:hypothetical protein
MNKGVAQGSIISPALFNIFLEDLAYELETETGIDPEDQLYYADDLLLICSDLDQVERAITLIEQWSQRNGMSLNKEKSGIVIFANRHSKKIPLMKKSNSEMRTHAESEIKIKNKNPPNKKKNSNQNHATGTNTKGGKWNPNMHAIQIPWYLVRQ